MNINTSHLENIDQFISSVLESIEEDKALQQFARCYLAQFPIDEWLGREQSDLLTFLKSQFLFLQSAPDDHANIQIVNPNIEEHGWMCGRTVVSVLQRDTPFLVDSIRNALNTRDISIHVIYSCIMDVKRANNKVSVAPSKFSKSIKKDKEALIYLEISLHTDENELAGIKEHLLSVLKDVKMVVEAYKPIEAKLNDTLERLRLCDKDTNVCDFLIWLQQSHFTFLGYREYDLLDGDRPGILENNDARLGIFNKLSHTENFVKKDDFEQGVKQFYESDSVICFSKSSTRSTVHRHVYPDYVVVKKYNEKGVTVGEVRFLGLFTYSVYTLSPLSIPLLKEKVDYIVEASGLDPVSHAGKNLIRVVENFPKEELFQSDKETLFKNIWSIATINERHVVRLILRRDTFGQFVNCMVYVPKESYNTEIRIKIQSLIGDALGSTELDSTTYFSESILARAQFVFRVDGANEIKINEKLLEESILDITRNWQEKLLTALVDSSGEHEGITRYNEFKNAFPQSYQEHFDARSAVTDIDMIKKLNHQDDIEMALYHPAPQVNGSLRFKVMHLNSPLELSDVIPILENLGLRVLGEHPYEISLKNNQIVWIHDFQLVLNLPSTPDIPAVRKQFEQAFAKIWQGVAESDAFNRLILGARLSWREVSLLRAYAGYLKQISFNSTQSFIANTLVHHTEITRNLIALFKANFDPRLQKSDQTLRDSRLNKKIIDKLDSVENLNEDRVLRRYLDLIGGTLRTNYFQKDESENAKSYLSIKFSPKKIADIPEPRPEFEIYVYSPRVEGVHLRGGKVARGGLRWSDRVQDYRTEVLGLVKAQQVKNAVIVPTGAKGGFVAKQMSKGWTREEFFAEGVACYKLFIKGLLDITDNLINGEVIPPKSVIRHDEDDPYMVVAADKGTATFSDIANEISIQYGHWLGDAFASGGSQGYDHKGMGITAKGAWVSVQRHFRERGVDIQNEDFTVVGIGDMAGDVFGNGMLLSEHICLVAAFNHMHIFIDPHPNAKSSFEERKRLFDLPRSSWMDYEKSLISKGGGIFMRSAKSITISSEMKSVFGISSNSLTPTELIHLILRSEVDLIWNGGIGTYIKASWENHSDVGDKANDSLRVDGKDLRCKVLGEGGNLGATQLGRVEFGLQGGACNTDFIDNAAGVDCSDHEVNIKILLDELIANGDLTQKQRNQFLEDMTDDVSDLVLNNNYRQTLSISVAEFQRTKRTNEFRRFITFLESQGRLDRRLEFLPSDEEIVERQAKGTSLTRAELSVLISYAKVMLKDQFRESNISEDPYVLKEIETAFPEKLCKKYPAEMYNHRLKAEIVSTQVANDIINNLGITAGHRLIETTGASISEIGKAYIISRDVFQFDAFITFIKSLDNKVDSSYQLELMANMIRRVRRGTRWFLRNRRSGLDPTVEVKTFKPGIAEAIKITEKFVDDADRTEWLQKKQELQGKGVPSDWVFTVSLPSNLYSGLGIVEASIVSGKSIEQVAEVFFLINKALHLNWFASQITDAKVETYWQALARESYIDDLEAQVRKLSIRILKDSNGTIEKAFEKWSMGNEYLINRWTAMVNEVQGSQATDYAMFSVALKELIDLAQTTEHQK